MSKLRIHWTSLLISLLILAAGLLGSSTLKRIDQDLRVIYAEYTLATIDLGHISAELIRYRTTVLRAIDADTKEDFQHIANSLPKKQARIEAAIDRFVKASNVASSDKSKDSRELVELKAVQDKLDDYLASSHHTIQLLEERWKTTTPIEAQRLRDEAERHTAKDTANKLIRVTLEVDQLLQIVAEIANGVNNKATYTLRLISISIFGGSIFMVSLVVLFGHGRPKSLPRRSQYSSPFGKLN
jgi:chemoreceptor-like protein with four helix bundle sensory module